MNGESEGGMERLKQLKSGDELRVGGERFTVSDKTTDGLVLTPRNENGDAKLDWDQLNDRLIYSRHRGIDPRDVETDLGRSTCPECGGSNVTVSRSRDGGWMHCDDCQDTVDWWTSGDDRHV